MDVFDRKFPGQEYLNAIPIRREVGRAETVAVALNDAMRLGRIEYHSGSSCEGNAMSRCGKMHVQTLVLA
jgi:hypothetical protein